MREHNPRSDTGDRSRATPERNGLSLKQFRAIILGFCLTLFMAAGTGHAFALWNQSAVMTMQVKAGTLPSPALNCSKVPNEASVLVTWTPQRSGVTGYDVTVTQDGQTIKTASYLPGITSEKITAPIGLIYQDTYAVKVTARYGSWQAQPATWDTIIASKPLLALGPSISCS